MPFKRFSVPLARTQSKDKNGAVRNNATVPDADSRNASLAPDSTLDPSESMVAMEKSLAILQRDLDQPNPDLDACAKRLLELKIGLTKLDGIVPGAPLTASTKRDIEVARGVHECAAICSLKRDDTESFVRSVAQLRTFYLDYGTVVDPSPKQNLVLAMNLMRLLAENGIAEFHTELELVSSKARNDDVIAYVLRLEQYLMEGSYAKVTEACQNPPHPLFHHFLETLMVTMRDEIAACSEHAYKKLSIAEAMKVLSVPTDAEVRRLAEDRQWTINADTIVFDSSGTSSSALEQVPSMDLIKKSLNYAKELEQIV